MSTGNVKPLGTKAYGSIPHLPGSRRGEGDHGISDKQASILLEKTRDKHDLIIVQEKLDGSNVSVAKIKDEIVPLIRAGYTAESSNYNQHRIFARWVMRERDRFHALLQENERASAEWLLVAHGTKYDLPHEPFVIFDIIHGQERRLYQDVKNRCEATGLVTARLLHQGGPFSIQDMLKAIETSGHGALEEVEGAVWRVERKGTVDFLAKYVRAEKKDGKYFPENTGIPGDVFNTYPGDRLY